MRSFKEGLVCFSIFALLALASVLGVPQRVPSGWLAFFGSITGFTFWLSLMQTKERKKIELITLFFFLTGLGGLLGWMAG